MLSEKITMLENQVNFEMEKREEYIKKNKNKDSLETALFNKEKENEQTIQKLNFKVNELKGELYEINNT